MPQINTQFLPRKLSADEPQSVIHVPSNYKSFENAKPTDKSPTEASENTVVSPPTPDALNPADKVRSFHHVHEQNLTSNLVETDADVIR